MPFASRYRRRAPMRRRRRARLRRVIRRTRKTYTRGRRTYKSSRKSSAPLLSSIHLKSYLDPFHRNQNPRIPDGAVHYSQGISHQCSRQVTQSTANPITIMLIPGLEHGVQVMQDELIPTDVPGGALAMARTYRPLRWIDPVNYGDDLIDIVNPIGFAIEQVAPLYAKWRLVSSGMKLKLVNSTDDNSGWFESVRVSVPSSSEYFSRYKHQYPSPFVQLNEIIYTTDFAFPYADSSQSMVDNPSYVTDSLKNIDKHGFMLSPNSTDHRFRTLENQFLTDNAGVGGGVGRPDGWVNWSTVAAEAFVDDSYDVIICRIHGTDGGTASEATRLQLTSTHNHEYVYDISNPQYKLQTQSPYVPTERLRMTARKKNISLRKAAVNLLAFYRTHSSEIRGAARFARTAFREGRTVYNAFR